VHQKSGLCLDEPNANANDGPFAGADDFDINGQTKSLPKLPTLGRCSRGQYSQVWKGGGEGKWLIIDYWSVLYAFEAMEIGQS
jgi:hypothetical protein